MEEFSIKKLRERGLRVTPQRQAMVEFLKENTTHPTAETIYHEMLKLFPRISFATVYKNLETLVETNYIQKLDIDPHRERFDPCITPHHHFYCKVCGGVFDVVYDGNDQPCMDLLTIKSINGHQVDAIDINYKGVCKECREKLKH